MSKIFLAFIKDWRIKNMTLINKIIAFENGVLSDDEIISLFQELLDTGMVWNLQGFYGRTAQRLIDSNLIFKNN